MRIVFALRSPAAGRRALPKHPGIRGRSSLHPLLVLVAAAAAALAGCGSDLIEPVHARHISKERVALLKKQPLPKCEFKTSGLGDPAKRQSDAPSASGDTNPEAAMRTKLDYERQCYKHAEMIVRARLTALQTAVARAANRSY